MADGCRSALTWSCTTGTVIGDGCVIEDHAVLGKRPRLAPGSSAAGEVGRLELGKDVKVCSGAVVFAGARVEEGSILGDQSYRARAHADRRRAR